MEDRCFWCFQEKPIYAYNLCISCYRWFNRHIKVPLEYCSMCGMQITKKQRGMCKKCHNELVNMSSVPKRVLNLESKFEPIQSILNSFDGATSAVIGLDPLFKPKQKKLLDILTERYYNHTTLEQVGKTYGCTREYVRQCENRAIEIITNMSNS